MFNANSPILICAITVTLYWFIVFMKSLLISKKIGKAPNVIPKETAGMLSRLVMLPLILLWMVLPWQAYLGGAPVFLPLAWIGATVCFFSLFSTIYCWHYMGTAWRIGIDPKEKNLLIIDGPFKYSRHPIYALSMLLMFGSFLTVQTVFFLILLIIHWLLFFFEAYREERYLSLVHGEPYRQYLQQTHRFLPLCRRAKHG